MSGFSPRRHPIKSLRLNSHPSPVPVFVPKSNHPATLKKKKQLMYSDWLTHQWNQIIRILTMPLLPVHKQQWSENSHDYYYPSPVVFSEFEFELEIEFAADSDHPNNHTILICCFCCFYCCCCCCCCGCSTFFFFFRLPSLLVLQWLKPWWLFFLIPFVVIVLFLFYCCSLLV